MKKLSLMTVLLTLALISSWFICLNVILPNVNSRIQRESEILSGQMEPPYQYRLLKPLLGAAVGAVVSVFTESAFAQHVVSYVLISFATFLGVFFSFYSYLRYNFSQGASLIGVLLLQAVIPLAVTGEYMEGDFINLFFYILGLIFIQREKYRWLPLLFVVGTLNREQFIFLAVWCAIYLFAKGRMTLSKALLVLACFLTWSVVFAVVRMYFGFKPSQYTFALHVARNTDALNLFGRILPLWAAEVGGFAVLSVLAFRKSDWFYRLSFLSLLPYGVLFFLNGNMWELAKFLPAFLAMIPMSLQGMAGAFDGE
ncbi:MAG: hypothetical protein LDL51_09270 [Chloroflexi bacterium]|nr:hypothetical protein [Chloroflexota bacterium]